MPIPSSLQTLLLQFQNRYPLGGLCAELLTIHQNHYVVRALVQVGNLTVASAMATAADLEAAEERAKIRVLECLGLANPGARSGSSPSLPPSLHVPQLNIPEAALTAAPPPSPPASPASRSDRFGLTPEPTVVLPTQPISPLPVSPTGDQPKPVSDLPELPSSEPQIPGPAAPAALTGALQTDLSSPELAPAARPAATAVVEPSDDSPGRTAKPEKTAKRKSEPSLEAVPAAPAASVDRSQEVMRIGIEMKRLGWSTEQGREYLKRTYGKRSRQELDDAELLDFLHYLESQPSTLQAPF